MNTLSKVLSLDALATWRTEARNRNQRIVATNGCFDILHAGHVNYLEQASTLGDLLIVGLNSDRSVRELKGPTRPVNPEGDRARVLAALQAVAAVCVFDELRATRFLEMAQPDVYVKGGDFTIDQLPAEERAVVARIGATIATIGLVPGRSTTGILRKITGITAL